MLCEIVDCSRALLYAYPDESLTDAQVRTWKEMVARRLRHEPIQYIVGYTEFYGLRIELTPAVLIPRPETEQVVEAALRLIEEVDSPRIFDVGTGSGCIAVAVKKEREDADVVACDVSTAALAVAERNAALNGVDVRLLAADLFSEDFAAAAPHDLDLIVSNPPYVTEAEASTLSREVLDHEPHLALFASGDPVVFYRRLAEVGRSLLREGGWLVVETHAEHGAESAKVVQEMGYREVELRCDYAGRLRILIGRR